MTAIRTLLQNFNAIAIGLRGASILGKFLLITFLARFLSLADLGIYGLFQTSVLLVIAILGFEFHTYTTRQILRVGDGERPLMVRNQSVMHLLAYLLILPLTLIIFWGAFLPWQIAIYFYLITILLHMGQEITRLLITLSRATAAYFVSFFLQGLWTYLYVGTTLLVPTARNLDVLFIFWLFSAAVGVAVGLLLIASMGLLRHTDEEIDWGWIKNGLRVSTHFFLGVLAYRVIDLSDRYFVQYFNGETAVGIYTLFGSVANIAQDFIYAGIVALIFPRMVHSFQNQDYAAYADQLRRLKRDVSRGAVVMALLLTVGIFILILLLGRDELRDQIAAFFLLLSSNMVLIFSFIPHYQLYVHGKDNLILRSVIAGVLVNLILNSILIPYWGIIGAGIATVVSFSLVGFLKAWFLRSKLQRP
jgi:O-antigen/teichoic acid export membrane protein